MSSLPYHGSHIPSHMVTSALELPAHRIVRNVGIVRGIVVRSRSVVGSFAAGLQTLGGGNITIWSGMGEKAPAHSHHILGRHPHEHRANAIVGMRHDAH